jgi:leader peptidase (prepilin peptidase) / N-methyltransferase
VIDGSLIEGPVRQVFLSLVLIAAVAGSLLAAPGLDGLLGAFLAALMLAVAIVDSRRFIIPNELTAAAVALALFRAGAVGPEADLRAVMWAGLRALAVAVPLLVLMIGYRRWRGRDGLGLGDVKLAAVAGGWLGFVTIFAVIELAALSALGAYVISEYLRKRPLKRTAFLPFGLFLAPAIWIGWLAEVILGQQYI